MNHYTRRHSTFVLCSALCITLLLSMGGCSRQASDTSQTVPNVASEEEKTSPEETLPESEGTMLPEEETTSEEETSPSDPSEDLRRTLPDGYPASGWIMDEDGTRGYCSEDGILYTGFHVIEGSRYLFTENGDMVTGSYIGEDGQLLLFTDDGKQYLNSVAPIGKDMYYFDGDGHIVRGATIELPGGGTGMTDEEGRLYTGSHRFGDEVYTFTSFGRLRNVINANTPMVALTYDDGPSETNTPIILDTLRTYGAHATFFVCGRNVERCRDIIQAIEDTGSEIGNHTYNHYMIVNMDAAVTNQEISSTSSYVQMITNNRPAIMRPPTGATNEVSRANVAAVDNGYPLIIWSVDTVDWQHHDAATTIDKVLTEVRDGSIVLMHDMEASSAIASQTIIPELINRGYQLVTVSELAAARGVQMQPGSEYSHFYLE